MADRPSSRRRFELAAGRLPPWASGRALGDRRQVAVLQGDRVESALPVLQGVREVELVGAGNVVADSSLRSRCRATKLMIGTGRSGFRDFDQLGQLLSLLVHELQVCRGVASQRISSSRNRISPS